MRILFASMCLLSACATTSSSSSVAVEGEDIDVSLMAGRWEGTYEGIESGRRGTISLDLAAGNRVAEGKVVMNAGAPQEKLLPIKFFKVGGKEVNGKIEPYTDPGCNCTVNTEFVGKVRGNLISGTFTTQPEGGSAKQNGRWSAERKR